MARARKRDGIAGFPAHPVYGDWGATASRSERMVRGKVVTATAQNPTARDSSSDISPARRCDPVVFALIALTFFTGVIDAVSFLGLGRVFTANMTGNVVLLGFAAAGVPGLSVARSLAALAAFFIGAAAGGRLANIMA